MPRSKRSNTDEKAPSDATPAPYPPPAPRKPVAALSRTNPPPIESLPLSMARAIREPPVQVQRADPQAYRPPPRPVQLPVFKMQHQPAAHAKRSVRLPGKTIVRVRVTNVQTTDSRTCYFSYNSGDAMARAFWRLAMAMTGHRVARFFAFALSCGITFTGAFKSLAEITESHPTIFGNGPLCAMQELTVDQLTLLGLEEDDPAIDTLHLVAK